MHLHVEIAYMQTRKHACKAAYKKTGLLERLQVCKRVCMIVALTNLKGGVGKSTISVHLAVWFSEQGKKVALVDTDVQAGSSTWLQEAAPEIKNLRLQTPDDILEEIPKLQGEYEHIIVDGPAGLAEVTRTILLLTDRTFL